MPAARGVKRTASKTSASTASAGPKNKKKRNVIQLEVPKAPKQRGCVLTCGQNDVGQLGLGEDVVEINKFKLVSGLGNKIVDACAGGMHTVALDSDGKVWTFGCNDEGALGRPTSGESDEGTPQAVSLPKRVVKIAAGDSHTAALLENGDVYAWGSFRDSHGSMGLVMSGREGKACRAPVQLRLTESCADIASGGDHLVLLGISGSVYTMGCGEQGQLGRLAQRSASRDARQGFSALLNPSKVTLKTGASRIWAGYHATVILDGTQEKVIAWGLNNYGQLGVTGEKRKTALFTPTECDAFSSLSARWQGVACGQHHSLALDASGQVYAIGRCEYGRLGLGVGAGDAASLEPVPMLRGKRVTSIAAGTSNSFAVTDTGEVLSWGMGSEGQLGTGQSDDAAEPKPAVCLAIGDLTPTRVCAGGQHTVLTAADPSAAKEPSPVPETETAEQKPETIAEEEEAPPEPEKKGRAGRAAKRQKKHDQDEEISSTSTSTSTSSAQPSTASTASTASVATRPQKVNGDEKKETPMEVDETDKPQENKEDASSKPAEDQKQKQTEQMDTEIPEKTETESESTQDSTQDSVETKSEDSQDVDMTETKQNDTKKQETQEVKDVKEVTEVNGTEEVPEAKEAKTVESVNEPAAVESTA